MTRPEAPQWLLNSLPPGSERRRYPFLASLLDSWFHQDYALESKDFREIVRRFRDTIDDQERLGVIADVQEFVKQYGNTDDALTRALATVFYPAITVEGWDGLTTRQWLLTVADLLG